MYKSRFSYDYVIVSASVSKTYIVYCESSSFVRITIKKNFFRIIFFLNTASMENFMIEFGISMLDYIIFYSYKSCTSIECKLLKMK